MTTVDLSRVRPTADELAALYADGKTNAEIARLYCVAENTVKSWRYNYGLPTRRPRYKEVIPWRVLAEHQDEYPVRMLRLFARRRDGLPNPENRDEKLDVYLAKLRGQHKKVNFDGVMRVVVYASWRTPGFTVEPGEWLNGEIPIRLDELPPPAEFGGKHRRLDDLLFAEDDDL